MKIYIEPARIRFLIDFLRHVSWNMEEDVLDARKELARLSWAWEGEARDDFLYHATLLSRRWDDLLDDLITLLRSVEREISEWEELDHHYADLFNSKT